MVMTCGIYLPPQGKSIGLVVSLQRLSAYTIPR